MHDGIAELWSFARQNLRLSDAEFWDYTPREIKWLIDRADDTARDTAHADDRRAATICMVLANINRDPERRPSPFTIEDFMPIRGDEPVKEQSWETQKAIFGAIAAVAKKEEPNG